MLNKYILSEEGFNYPIMLASFGMLVSGLVAAVLIHVFKVDQPHDDVDLEFWFKRILPIGCVGALCLATGNIPYLYISVSYIQILKALCPVFTLTVLSLWGLETPTLRLCASVGVIAVGTIIACLGEIEFSWFGTCLMLVSEMLEALKLGATQQLLGSKHLSPLQGTYYLCPATFLCLAIGVAFAELNTFIHTAGISLLTKKPMIYILAASLGFGVNFLSVGVIRYASSLWLKVLGQAKNAALVYGSTLVFHNIVTLPQYIGYGISLLGFGFYSYVKAQQQQAPAPASPENVKVVREGRLPITAQASVDNFAQLNKIPSISALK
eukprot:CAMPEP_0196591238 /NCGR_PEP_ID=MMETSP1081-20130531/68921_1 /TAXON_ID=36882 /ORGANISM="Pyramimonas amylifera, Strain CCMP720" /LENGTH=323 /DNA_ID=CAMNT_0041914541 /DNA_START=170 /DNA_END=1141 /DNA_ORIENTATION=-